MAGRKLVTKPASKTKATAAVVVAAEGSSSEDRRGSAVQQLDDRLQYSLDKEINVR